MLRQKDDSTPLRVSDLISFLRTLPPDAVVVQSQDCEGNRFAPTHEIWGCHYQAASQDIWVGNGAPPAGAEPAVCLWPSG